MSKFKQWNKSEENNCKRLSLPFYLPIRQHQLECNRLQSIVNLIDHLKRIKQIEEFENSIHSETELNMCIFRYAENDFYNSTVSFEWWRYENAKKEFFQKIGIDESRLPSPIPVESAKSRRKK